MQIIRQRPRAILQKLLFREVDIASLAFFRISVGILLFIFLSSVYEGRLLETLTRPGFHCRHLGFGWLPGISMGGLTLLVWFLRGMAVCIALGLFYRVSTALFFLGYAYIFLLDATVGHNHPYLICLLTFLMIFMPAHRAYSADTWLRPALRKMTTPIWPIWALRLQFFAVYFYAGVAKLNYDWLNGEPVRSRLEEFPVGRFMTEYGLTIPVCYAGLLFDLLVPFFLMSRRTRLAAYLISVIFHVSNSMMWILDIFPFLMLLGTLIYFDPDWPRRDLMGRNVLRVPEPKLPGVSLGWSWRQRAVLAFLCVFLSLQYLAPLRQFVYPGDSAWTGEGHTFAWRMMTSRKRSLVRFMATDPDKAETWEINPVDFGAANYGAATPWSIPHHALAFAHHAAAQLREQGRPRIEVRAEIWCSLHQRKPQLLLDPKVDLAAQPRSILPATWIMPLTEPLPVSTEERLASREHWESIGNSRREF